MSTTLTLFQDFCNKWGLPAPTGVVGSTDTTYTNLLALAHEALRDLVLLPWNETKSRATFTSVNAEDQGSLLTLLGTGYRSIVPGTGWNVTDNMPLFGPLGDISWQIYKSFVNTGPLWQYKVMGGHLFILPNPGAGKTLSFMIDSAYGVRSSGGSPQERILADTDTVIIPDNVFLAELEWRWLRQKGRSWTAAYAWAQNLIGQTINKDSSAPMLNLGTQSGGATPGIWVGGVPT